MPKPIAALLAVAALVVASSARAEDTKHACIDASEKGQALRDDHKLATAREQFLLCARDVCPGPIKRDCADWLAGVDKSMPSVIIVAKDGSQDLSKVSVDLDGKRVKEELDGAAMNVDPGSHLLHLTMAGRPPIDETVVVREGEKGRRVLVDFAPKVAPEPAPPPPAAAPFHVPAAAWALGGVAVVAGGVFGAFGITGKNDLSHLRDTCGQTGTCKQTDVDAAHSKLVVADVALYGGIAALAAATIVTIVANGKKSPSPVARVVGPRGFAVAF